ncbi:MAG: hypothetical protein HY553_14210 [Elusimicrobia bacterium]|nr:hypothetical protein [Elusimicrobiota bacterium]
MSIERLERARQALEDGGLREALRLLPGRARIPAALRGERDLVEADALRGQGFFGRSEELYRRLLSFAKRDPHVWLEAALGSAAGLRSVGDTARATALLDSAERLARRADGAWALPKIRLERVLVARAEGRWSRCLPELQRLLAGALRERDLSRASFLLWAIGGALRFSGDLEGSRRAFERSRALARRAGDASAEGYAVFGLGGVTRIQGDLRSSERWYRLAMKSFARTDDRFAQAYAHCGLANSLRQQAKRAEAERHYRLARGLYSSLGDPVDLAYVDWGLGKLRLDDGRPREAAPLLERALAAFSRGNELRGECLSEVALSQALHALGRTTEAERLFTRAVRRGRAGGLHAHLELYT